MQPEGQLIPAAEVNALVTLEAIVQDFANGLIAADHRRPQAVDAASGALAKPGIGPLPDAEALRLIARELELAAHSTYAGSISLDVPYPDAPDQTCSLCIGAAPAWALAAEVRMLRYVSEDGRLNDNILAHHRAAVAGCVRLAASPLGASKAVIIYGFDDRQWPLDPAIDGFERLARAKVELGPRCEAKFDGLWHPVYARGRAFGWTIA